MCIYLGVLLHPTLTALLVDRSRDQMVFGDFNAHYPSWFSRTGDDRAAARGETLDGAINSSQLAVTNQNLPTYLPSRYHPSERTSPSRCAVVDPYHPWVLPTPHNRLPFQLYPALTAENSFLHKLLQG